MSNAVAPECRDSPTLVDRLAEVLVPHASSVGLSLTRDHPAPRLGRRDRLLPRAFAPVAELQPDAPRRSFALCASASDGRLRPRVVVEIYDRLTSLQALLRGYHALGVAEVILVEPQGHFLSVFRAGRRRFEPVPPTTGGWIPLQQLKVQVRGSVRPRLQLRWSAL